MKKRLDVSETPQAPGRDIRGKSNAAGGRIERALNRVGDQEDDLLKGVRALILSTEELTAVSHRICEGQEQLLTLLQQHDVHMLTHTESVDAITEATEVSNDVMARLVTRIGRLAGALEQSVGVPHAADPTGGEEP